MAKASTKATSPVSGWPMKILAIVLALLLVFGIAWSVIESSGMLQRSTVTLKSEHYEVNNAMLSYFYETEYANFLSEYSYYLSYFGLDTSKSLKLQYYSKDTTWYEYFLQSAINTAKDLMILCEAALDAGMTIGEKEQTKIDEAIQAIKDNAKAYKMSIDQYVSGIYGSGVKLGDVKNCLELSALASKQYNAMIDSYEWTEEDYNKWAEDKENKNAIWFVDYMKFTFTADFEKTDDDETKEKARQEAKALADKLAEKKTEDEFFQWIVDYEESIETEEEKKKEEEEAKKEAAETGGETDAEGNKVVKPEYEKDDYTITKYGFADATDLDKWVFEDGRAVNDTTVIYDKEKETYTAILMLKTIYRFEYKTVSVRHILFKLSSNASKEKDAEVKDEAQKILDQYLAGDKTPEAFGALAKEHTADSNGEDGGLYENILKDEMVEEFNDWIYDEARKPGDTGLVKTDYGYHVMYFEGEGLIAWQVAAENGLTSDQYEEDYAKLEKAHEVKVDIDNAYKLEG